MSSQENFSQERGLLVTRLDNLDKNSLTEVMISDIWEGRIDINDNDLVTKLSEMKYDFDKKTVVYTTHTEKEKLRTPVLPTDIPPGESYYNHGLQILLMLLAMKRDGVERPSSVSLFFYSNPVVKETPGNPDSPPPPIPPGEPPLGPPSFPKPPPGPTPVDCIGDWSIATGEVCSKPCGGGKIKKVYNISRKSKNGGVACPYKHRDTKLVDCNLDACPRYEETPSIDPNDACLKPGEGYFYVFKTDSMKVYNIDPYKRSRENYIGKVFSSGDNSCIRTINGKQVNFSVNTKHCLTNQSNTYQYAYSFGGTSDNGIYDKNLCADKEQCLYVAYTQVEGGKPCELGDTCRSFRNAKGEHLMDRMVEEIWCGKINPDDFLSTLHMEAIGRAGVVHYKKTAPAPYSGKVVKPTDILITRLDEYNSKTNKEEYYNIALQMLHMLLVMKKYDIPKPRRVYPEIEFATPSS